MKINKRTINFPVADLRLREEGEGGNGRTIEGYALKFGVRSQLICDWYDTYYEILEPGSVTVEMLDRQDFILSLYHDPHRVLGRSNHGKGTLHYDVDEVGVKFWCEMPNTADGDEALELVKRGDLDGCSFIYSTDECDNVTYTEIKDDDGNKCLLRRVIKIDNIYDFTLTWRPAYKQTECSAREREAIDAIVNPNNEDNIIKENDRESEAEEARRREVESLRSDAALILRD
jgi:HK97 family phage prohead protease